MTITTRVSTERILRELNAAKSAMTLPLIFATLSSVALAVTWAMWQEPSLFWKRVAWVAFWPDITVLLLSTLLFDQARRHYQTVKLKVPQPPPPRRDVEDLLNFDNQAPARALELQPSVNLLLLTKYKFTPSEWRQLVRELRYIKPRWTRRALERSGLFLNITAPGVFAEVSEDFARVGVIAGKSYKWRVTNEGWEAMCKAAGLQVVI